VIALKARLAIDDLFADYGGSTSTPPAGDCFELFAKTASTRSCHGEHVELGCR